MMNRGKFLNQVRKIIVILFSAGICCALVLLGYNRNTPQEKVVLLIDGGRRASCREIIVEDCRDECIDYSQDKETLLFVNRKNQIVEKNIAGEEQVMDIEAVDLSQTVSNVQYAPFGEGLYFICGGEIYQYSFRDKAVAKKTNGIDSSWRKTYIWETDEYGYKLADNGKFSELYSMDMKENLEQKVCEGWIQSIGQAQGDTIYALQVYAKAAQDSSTADLRNRIIAIDTSNGTIEIIQELGNWMEGNYLFACDEDNCFYIQKRGKKECLYRFDLSAGSKEKVFCTRNQVIGLAVH